MGNPNCCFMIIAVIFFFSRQSPRGNVTGIYRKHILVKLNFEYKTNVKLRLNESTYKINLKALLSLCDSATFIHHITLYFNSANGGDTPYPTVKNCPKIMTSLLSPKGTCINDVQF